MPKSRQEKKYEKKNYGTFIICGIQYWLKLLYLDIQI